MTTIEKVKISDAEWEIMRVVWSKKQASSQEIVAVLKEKMDWKPATIKTLIGRLVKKEALKTEAAGHRFIYFPRVTEAESVMSATENLFAHVCSKKIGQTIGALIEEATLTHEDIQLLEKLIESKKELAVDEIACNCVPGQCECQEHNN
ncbi:CopY/TcrY family copper transport repressor [Carnobacterium gallinarum]|uniref:CopY/TcrY family copper transport repressor n=1 Tax=Carnobacterium gallinarum TaxID=2749 RepID=UPI000551A8E2|nr:CopY/TcrY family copper transport repressor [Carnobacterium gallinarum]